MVLGAFGLNCLLLVTAGFTLAPMSYDATMINSLYLFQGYTQYFKLDSSLVGLNVAIVSAGSFAIGPFAGLILDKYGRKSGMYLAASLSLISVIIQTSAPNEAAFVVGRFILGISIVMSITAATSMLMELAPPKSRGLFVSGVMAGVNFLNIWPGVAAIFLDQQTSNWSWRGLILGEGIEPLLALCLIPFLDESPRWLVYKGRHEEALQILAKLHTQGNEYDPSTQLEFQEICETLAYEKATEGSWKSLIKPFHNFKRFMIAVLCAIFSQITGAYTIPYFQTLIITNAGVTDQRKALSLTTGISFWVWSCMCIGSPLVDRVGRKRIFLGGTSIMTICLAVMAGLGYASESTGRESYGIGQILMLFIFMGSMAASWLLLAFVYPPEILKFSQRAKGVAASQAIGYGFSCMNQYTLPIAIAKISWRYYAIVGGWNVLIIALMWWLFIETKGRTLEEIDEIFEGVLHTTVAMGVKGLDGDGQEPGRAPVVLDATRVTTIEEDVLPDKLRKV